MSAQVLLDRLSKVTRRGDGRWMARCPAHDDRTPSLAVAELSDGRVLVKCFAGCGAVDVVGAVGLGLADLMPEALGEYRSFVAMEREHKDLTYAETLLRLMDAKRARGEKLNRRELEQERQAYLTVRHANAE